MKNAIAIIIVLSALSCKAQLVPVPPGVIPIESFQDHQGSTSNIDYIKDVNHLLDKYEGTWIGTYNNKEYKIVINGFKRTKYRIKEDMLLLRYKITNTNGQEIINTLNLPNNDTHVINGSYMENGGKSGEYYVMDYLGEESLCGQKGAIYIYFFGNGYGSLRLFLAPSRHHIVSNNCPNGHAEQVFPTATESQEGGPLTLTKQ